MNTDIILDALNSPQGRLYAVIIVACSIAVAAGAIGLVVLHRGASRARPLRDEDGTATIEFALVFPILLFLILVLAQTTFLMGGNIFVHYSAFAATRSAIVQIPTEYFDDKANTYTAADGRTKHDLIWRSAVFAVMPVAGESASSTTDVAADQFVQGLRRYYEAYGKNEPAWIDALAAGRARYAAENTRITVMTPEVQPDHSVTYREIPDGSSYAFKARDPITVAVTHRFALGVPYVSRLYADGQQPGGKGRYTTMSARYTLTNEGVRDELPPKPNVPRRTP